MKHSGIKLVLFAAVAVMMLFSSCKRDDTMAPYITLEGDNPLYVTLEEMYDPENPGAMAQDNVDHDINTIQVTHDVETKDGLPNQKGHAKKTGTYTATYTAADEAGNSSSQARSVKVVNSVDKFMGEYLVDRDGNDIQIGQDYVDMKATLRSDNQANWMFRLPKLSGKTGLRVDAYVSKKEDGTPGTTDQPHSYVVSIIEAELAINPDTSIGETDTVFYRIYGITAPGDVTKQISYLDTLKENENEPKYKFVIKYGIEKKWPYFPVTNPQQVNFTNQREDDVTEIYDFKY
ncbi:MAG: DUF5011 domain-containing protein [Bacteroidetes bacterium]|nr:DUF5011 domain-containing protein [Bacteroidota bacterium]